jgi:hypothetical protein
MEPEAKRLIGDSEATVAMKDLVTEEWKITLK